jgi:hypothetical protein
MYAGLQVCRRPGSTPFGIYFTPPAIAQLARGRNPVPWLAVRLVRARICGTVAGVKTGSSDRDCLRGSKYYLVGMTSGWGHKFSSNGSQGCVKNLLPLPKTTRMIELRAEGLFTTARTRRVWILRIEFQSFLGVTLG